MCNQFNPLPINYTPPQAAVSYDLPTVGSVVDASCFQQLSSCCQKLQADNISLYGRLYDTIQKKMDATLLNELLQFDKVSFCEDQGRPCVLKKNQANQLVGFRLSECYGFEVICTFDFLTNEYGLDISFFKPEGSQQMFSIPIEKYTSSKLHNEFSKHGGCLTYKTTTNGANLFFAYISGKINWNKIVIKNFSGWSHSADNGAWKFSKSKTYDLSRPLFFKGSLENNAAYMCSLLFTCSLLKGRLPNTMGFPHPFYVVTTTADFVPDVSLSEKPTVFQATIMSMVKYKPYIVVQGESLSDSPSKYSIKQNQLALLNIAKATGDVIFLVVSERLTLFCHEHCLPITFSPSEGSSHIPITTAALIDFIKGNSQVVDSLLRQGFEKGLKSLDDEHPARKELATLSAVSALLGEFLRIQCPDLYDGISVAENRCFQQFQSTWDYWEDGLILNRFRNAMYHAKHDQVFRFEDKLFPSEKFNSLDTVLFDDVYLYISSRLIKNILATYMPEFSCEIILNELVAAGVVLKPCKMYITLSHNSYIEPRLRMVPRTFLKKCGERDITNI